MVSGEKPSIQEKLAQVPDRPGVYFFKDSQGTVLYVGKATSLRKRVFSYFQPTRPLTAKGMHLVRQTADLEWIVTGSEAEALLYESSLIKERQPKYNVSFRDDKSYPFIKVTAEETFPRLFIGRGQEAGVKTIGPFANAALLKQAFRAIRRILPFRTCRTLPKRACLDYYLKLCPAPCEGRITPEQYQQNLSQVFRLMEGRKEEVLRELEGRMQAASKERRYEEAAKIRDQISGLIQLTARPRRLIPSEALADLQSLLKLPRFPSRIEAFDVSNIYGREPVGSMVTFVDGKPWKDGYRRFKVKTVPGINDYAMMREIVSRRFAEQGWTFPDLVVIDGGKGHLNCALEVLADLKLDLPAIGIAKEFEQLFLPSQSEPILLPPQSKALQLVQRLRDEAHRFAIGYHRLLRGKQALRSALDEIPGVGPRRKQDLLIRFGSVAAMRKASEEDLAQVRGISQRLARRILQQLNNS